jgi:hypothetical protein
MPPTDRLTEIDRLLKAALDDAGDDPVELHALADVLEALIEKVERRLSKPGDNP